MADGIYSVGMNPQLTEKVLRLDTIIRDAVSDILGIRYVKRGKEVVAERVGRPLVNNEGAAVFESWLRSLVNRNTLMAAIRSDDEADSIIFTVTRSFINDFALHAAEYELDLVDLDRLTMVFMNYAQLVLTRAVKELHSDKEFLQHSVVEQHVTSEVSEKSNKEGGGFLGNLFK